MATLVNLPVHDLPMDVPEPSEKLTGPNGEDIGYRWILTVTEWAHIAQMLDVKASELMVPRGNIMTGDRVTCDGCGKHSGLDDLVHNALFAGIHSASFMIEVLVNGPKRPSPAHELICSRCATKHNGHFGWPIGVFDWVQDI